MTLNRRNGTAPERWRRGRRVKKDGTFDIMGVRRAVLRLELMPVQK